MRLFMRILPILLLCAPVLIVILVAILYFLGMTDFLSNAFWASLGTWKLFALTSDLLEGFVKNKNLDITFTVTAYLQLLVKGATDAIYLGACRFAFKSLFFNFESTRNDIGTVNMYLFTRPIWLLEIIAVCLGVAVRPLFGFGSQHLTVILQGAVSILLIIFGMTFFGKAGRKHSGATFFQRFVYNMLIPVLVGALNSVAVANMLTVLLDGPRMLQNGAYPLPMLAWYAINVLLLFAFSLLEG